MTLPSIIVNIRIARNTRSTDIPGTVFNAGIRLRYLNK